MTSDSSKNRYVRIPIPLKREVRNSSFRVSFGLIKFHKRSIEREKARLGITDYGLHWIQFFRGAIVAIILERLIIH